ncbi:MAG: hypothetical protein LBL66_11395 [Clostridiales bacterium]|nr:hypothetical protein [Clostridiales bacterium]
MNDRGGRTAFLCSVEIAASRFRAPRNDWRGVRAPRNDNHLRPFVRTTRRGRLAMRNIRNDSGIAQSTLSELLNSQFSIYQPVPCDAHISRYSPQAASNSLCVPKPAALPPSNAKI